MVLPWRMGKHYTQVLGTRYWNWHRTFGLDGRAAFTDVSISAIDIDPHAIEAATINIEQSPWKDRITCMMAVYLTTDFPKKFDAIICNPISTSTLGNRHSRAKEPPLWHTDSLDHLQLAKRCFEITTETATASFIPPTPEGEGFIKLAKQCGYT